ncbi:MAG: hypothetical protein ACR2PX_17765 [Endozoicomonas sp.]|uniref:hypothetical protein n=1 Tax=Endozoicomonas sp. TaxID=1892382 RepID=UPI003D9BCE53
MRYIPLGEVDKSVLEDWQKKSDELLNDLKDEADPQKRKVIIHRNKDHWRDPILLSFLKALSGRKCWYTEARFTAEYPHLEHFRPKSCARNEHWEKCHEGYWWLAFDIENYRLSKPMPNTRKGTYFPLRERVMAVCTPGISISREYPLLLDPANEDDAALIGFNSHGEPEPCREPAIDLDEWDRERIAFSIKRYGLDDQELCDERKALWVSITSMFDEYAENALKAKQERCIESAGKAKQIKKELSKYLDPEQPFTSLIRDCFNSHSVGRSLYRQGFAIPWAA